MLAKQKILVRIYYYYSNIKWYRSPQNLRATDHGKFIANKTLKFTRLNLSHHINFKKRKNIHIVLKNQASLIWKFKLIAFSKGKYYSDLFSWFSIYLQTSITDRTVIEKQENKHSSQEPSSDATPNSLNIQWSKTSNSDTISTEISTLTKPMHGQPNYDMQLR